MRRVLGASLVVFVMMSTAVAVAQLPPGGTFSDDNGNFHEPAIEAIAAAGITQGCDPPANDRYCPDDPVTRAEMAAFLLRATGEEAGLPAVQGLFSDVHAGAWYAAYTERLFDLGITTGCATDPLGYCPTASVSRAEMAAFILRAIGEDQNLSSHQGRFSDVPAGAWYAGYAERLFDLGITTGCAPGIYCPTDPVNRSQMASFLTRALNLTPITPPPPAVPSSLIADRVAEGSLRATPRGAGIDSLNLDLQNLRGETLEVEIPAGTYFVAGSGAVQNMVVRTAKTVVLAPNQLIAAVLDVVCANLQRDIPGHSDTFSVSQEHSDPMSRLMALLDDTNTSYDIAQAAAWIMTDNASFADLGTLVAFPTRERIIDENEAGRAMKAVNDAGIDITARRIWNDRHTIATGAGAWFSDWIAGL